MAWCLDNQGKTIAPPPPPLTHRFHQWSPTAQRRRQGMTCSWLQAAPTQRLGSLEAGKGRRGRGTGGGGGVQTAGRKRGRAAPAASPMGCPWRKMQRCAPPLTSPTPITIPLATARCRGFRECRTCQQSTTGCLHMGSAGTVGWSVAVVLTVWCTRTTPSNNPTQTGPCKTAMSCNPRPCNRGSARGGSTIGRGGIRPKTRTLQAATESKSTAHKPQPCGSSGSMAHQRLLWSRLHASSKAAHMGVN
jgi:hypothetical protein